MKLFLSPSGQQLKGVAGQVLTCIDGEEWEAADAGGSLPDGTHAFQVVAWDTGTSSYKPGDRIHVSDIRAPTNGDFLQLLAGGASFILNPDGGSGDITAGFVTSFKLSHVGGGETLIYSDGLTTMLNPPAGSFPTSGAIHTERSISGPKVGFYDAPPVLQPNITGSRGGNAALADLLSQLATAGLILDNTTA